ncbi:TPA: Holliday junction branch migration DNA helicase RuvB [candidate division WOR-3 bacterium]|jgi:Holliday junction DNA helicase RuvB|uniref:Holliday junction branch migration complex subunit RuvB n=1 Tax=candidate division WOR-3 bacterium TaxID=2052148 RepID=A0A350H8W9_UNCW3|nr:Holliday junction branch migration DNA helicase RuvB [candidate division WOR-3 bacterium]
MNKEIITSAKLREDIEIEENLRPKMLKNFVGQRKLKENLEIAIESAKKRNDILDHLLFFGPPGLGKTTLSYIVANEMGVKIYSTSGPVLDKPGDLAGVLTKLEKGDILFIDEIHRINRVVEEYLYPAMEDFAIDILIDSGPSARSVKLKLKPFTLIGATTRSGLLTAPMRSRFGISNRLDFYTDDDIAEILKRSSKILNIDSDKDGFYEIAKRSRGTPRIANRLLKRVRDYAVVKSDGKIDRETALKAMETLDVDSLGLDDLSVAILKTIIEKYNGGPVGVSTLAISVGETSETIEEVYEPFLIMKGLLKRTQRGRVATKNAYDHLGIKTEGQLFE